MIKVNHFGCCSKEVREFLKKLAFHGLRFEISPGIFTAKTSTLLQRLSQYIEKLSEFRECAIMPWRKILRKGTTSPGKIKNLKTDG